MLFKCADYRKGLELQYMMLNELQECKRLGRRTIPIYEHLEGIGGERRVQEEDIIIRIEEVMERINRMESYIKSIDDIINHAFKGDDDKKMFVEWYWFKSMPRDIRARKSVTMATLRFLTHDSFYDWRNKIYERLAEVAGLEAMKPGN